MKKILSNSIVILLIAVVVGLFTGRLVGEEGIRTILSIKQITGQIIFFLVPLIVIGFVAPSITALRQGATRLKKVCVSCPNSSSVSTYRP